MIYKHLIRRASATPSPQAPQGEGKGVPISVLTKTDTGGTGKPVPYRVRSCRTVSNPSVIADAMPAPLTQGSQWGALHKICIALAGCGSVFILSAFSGRAPAISVLVQTKCASEKTRNVLVYTIVSIPCYRKLRIGADLMRH